MVGVRGQYLNDCNVCECTFIGDKRAWNCADCTYDGISKPLLEDYLKQLESLKEDLNKEMKNLTETYQPTTPTSIPDSVSRQEIAKNKDVFLNSLRYKYVRRLNPREFAALFTRNLNGENFDEMIDNMILSEKK